MRGWGVEFAQEPGDMSVVGVPVAALACCYHGP